MTENNQQTPDREPRTISFGAKDNGALGATQVNGAKLSDAQYEIGVHAPQKIADLPNNEAAASADLTNTPTPGTGV